MAISRIAGQMLQTNLERDGVNLSFSNLDLGNSTPVLYLDVGNNQVGINNNGPTYTLDVTGNIRATANIYANNLSATANVIGGNVVSNNVYSTSGDLNFYSTSNGNILLQPDGIGFAKAIGTNGFVIPAGNTAQRPGTPDIGTIRFNTSLIQTEVWDGAEWVSATGTTSAITNQTLVGDGSTTVFSLNYSATAESILVTINGVLQTPTVTYTTDTNLLTITFNEAPAIADLVQVRFIAATTVLAALVNGTSNIAIPVSGGNIEFTSAGNTTFAVTNIGADVVGNLSAGNLSLTGNIVTPNVTGNLTAGNLSATGTVNATTMSAIGNINAGNLIASTVSVGNITNSNANGVGNIGSSGTYFDTVFAKATSAQYADLAELYSADAEYVPGTVVSFGGNAEITMSAVDSDPCVAGVVSTNPSYIMNAGCQSEYPTQVALTGRVPCQVIGPVTKGAMMVSAGNGAARAEKTPAMGTVIGKALEDFAGKTGVIEVVVGRL